MIFASFTEGTVFLTFTIDRTMIETVRKYLWICIIVDSGWKTVLGIYNSEENHFVATNFIRLLL